MAYDSVTRPENDSQDGAAEPASPTLPMLSERGDRGRLDAELVQLVQQYRAIFESLPPETRSHLEEELAEWRRPGWRERYDQELEDVKRRRSR